MPMSGWKVLGWSAAAGFGALMFLKLVADHIRAVERLLDGAEKREREAYEKRRTPPDDSEPLTAVYERKLA